MPRDLGALRRDVVAERTAVRLLARVRPPVHHQVRLLREVLAAELASVPWSMSNQAVWYR